MGENRKALRGLGWTAAVLLSFTALLFFVVWLPVEIIGAPPHLNSSKRVTAVNDLRAIFAQIAVASAVAAGLYFTARNFSISRESSITNRYTQAITALGEAGIAQRLGGLYALQRVAIDSEKDFATVASVVAAFLRASADSRGKQHVADNIEPLGKDREAYVRLLPRLAEDHQSALSVLGALAQIQEFEYNVRETNLCYARLRKFQVSRSNWRGVHLEGADMAEVVLREAVFREARLPHAWFRDADLHASHFEDADLRRAYFRDADLSDCVFIGADMREAVFIDTDLSGVVMQECDLTAAIGLTETQFAQMSVDDATMRTVEM